MFEKRWVQWLIVLLGWHLLGLGVAALVAAQGSGAAGKVIGNLTLVLGQGWLYYGLWQWRHRPWVKKLASLLIVTHIVYALDVLLARTGNLAPAIALTGIWAMIVLFVVGLALIRALLSPGWAVTGVARTVVDEAIRAKVALVFVVGMVLIVPILPFMLDAKERLQYRMQFFLTWSLTATAVLLGLMTIFLACGTICNEIKFQQIFLTMTKPVSRAQYLLGKWVGIVMLNLVLLSVAGVGVYAFARVLATTAAQNLDDRATLHLQVLTARETISPMPPHDMDMGRILAERIERLHRENPGGPELGERELQGIRTNIVAGWHTISPFNSSRFRFHGLHRAKAYGDVVQFRFKPRCGKVAPDEKVRLAFWLNDRPWPLDPETGRHVSIAVSEGNYHVLNFPLAAADTRGDLVVEIRNIDLDAPRENVQASVSFDPKDGLQMLYRVGSFEGNLVRSLAIMLVRLAFLAMLGLAAGTFLGFPVAALLCVMVYVAAGASDFLLQSLRTYANLGSPDMNLWQRIVFVVSSFFGLLTSGDVWGALKMVIRLLGEAFVGLVPSFSSLDPVPRLTDGRLVSYSLLGQAALQVGVIWTGLCALVGWAIFRRRELAKVIV